jgi:hypothetical protein
MYTNFIKAIKEDSILAVEVSDIREETNSITLDIPTADTQVITQTVIAIDKFLGNKNQNIYIERFGSKCTSIAIENPMLREYYDGTVIDEEDRDRTGYGNIIEEINTHELPRNVKPIQIKENPFYSMAAGVMIKNPFYNV